MKRIYESLLDEHYTRNRQMAFLTGPRQVGKTTTAREADAIAYYSWDNPLHREIILGGPEKIIVSEDLTGIIPKKTRIIFDEIHKFPRWKNFLKGFFDTYGNDYRILVTGSARLTVYRRGSDSLMGRYFNYRMHPVSPAELVRNTFSDTIVSKPEKINRDDFETLLEFGGFPEPFLKADRRFYNRWRSLRSDQLFKEDIRDLTSIGDINRLETLALLLENRVGQLVSFSSLASDVQVTVNTIKNWISTLESFHYCFRIKPWHINVPKTLLKQPKIYLRDWSIITDKGARNENFIACQLLKAVEFWTDAGFGEYDIFFLRDKAKREVDFLITENRKPWFLVEVKSTGQNEISSSLKYFAGLLKVPYSFQVDLSSDYIERDCFEVRHPIRVPALTFLSQLV